MLRAHAQTFHDSLCNRGMCIKMEKIKLYSKRNSVYRIYNNSKTYIVKKFSDIDYMLFEAEMLNVLLHSKASVPKIISVSNDEVMLEDLGDLTFLDWLEKEELNSSVTYHKMIIKLLGFLQKFYKVTNEYYGKQYIINDINLRNFLVNNNKVYGIDFELCSEGKIESDIGKMIAYIITYDPIATDWKYKFINDFVHIFLLNFNLNVVLLIKEIRLELNKIFDKRNLDINTDDIICKIAEEII